MNHPRDSRGRFDGPNPDNPNAEHILDQMIYFGDAGARAEGPPRNRAQRRAVARRKEAPKDAYAAVSTMARKAQYQVLSNKAIKQASAYLTYGDIVSAMVTLNEFHRDFIRRYGMTP